MILLDFSSVLTWPRVKVLAKAQVLTRWMASLPELRSWEPSRSGLAHRRLGRLAVYGHHLPIFASYTPSPTQPRASN